HGPSREEKNRADRRIQRREYFRGHQDLGAAERVEQSGLAGVGVAHQRDGPQRNGIARLAAERSLLTHFVDIGLNLAHALPNPPAIGLEFFLARAANADAPRAARGSARTT